MRFGRAGASVLACVLLLAGVARAEPGPVVEYLTIAANEAGASGGHAALRVGARVYHFEADAGRLELAREDWPDFRFNYRVLENRTLHASRIGVTLDGAEALARHFERRWWIESEERSRLAALRDDVALLEAFARRARGSDATLSLPGAGFFSTSAAPSQSAGSAALRALRRRIDRERGPGYAERRAARAAARLRGLLPTESNSGSAADAPSERPTLSRRYGEAFAAEQALAVLRAAPALRPEARLALAEDAAALAPGERAGLRALLAAQETRLARLVGSQRPDWGSAFLLGEARLAGLAESLASGRWVVLEALPHDAATLDAGVVQRAARPLRRRLARFRAELEAARRHATASPTVESALARIEWAASRYAELAGALGERRALRTAPGPWLPRGRGRVTDPPLPDFARAGAEGPLAAARARLRTARADFARRHRYDLITNNCVTAIFREVDAAGVALSPSGGGGPLGALRFVPFVSARLLRRGGRVVAERVLPSYRSERLAQLRRSESPWRVALRESNVFTSTIYRPNPIDSAFVFFTDSDPWSRPLLGAVNVADALLQGAIGFARLPWDGGASLGRAARGVAASLPELAFINIRKGSFPFADPPRPAGSSWRPSARTGLGGPTGP